MQSYSVLRKAPIIVHSQVIRNERGSASLYSENRINSPFDKCDNSQKISSNIALKLYTNHS